MHKYAESKLGRQGAVHGLHVVAVLGPPLIKGLKFQVVGAGYKIEMCKIHKCTKLHSWSG